MNPLIIAILACTPLSSIPDTPPGGCFITPDHFSSTERCEFARQIAQAQNDPIEQYNEVTYKCEWVDAAKYREAQPNAAPVDSLYHQYRHMAGETWCTADWHAGNGPSNLRHCTKYPEDPSAKGDSK